MNTTIYQNIATRTAGDIYIGVVGPVRTGKSTLIKQFMEKLVLPAGLMLLDGLICRTTYHWLNAPNAAKE